MPQRFGTRTCTCSGRLAARLTRILLPTGNQDAKPLRRIKPLLPADLETITMKCLHKEPGQRYESARALAEDMERCINGDSIREAQGQPVVPDVDAGAMEQRGGRWGSPRHPFCVSLFWGYGVQARLSVREEKARSAARARLSQEIGPDLIRLADTLVLLRK